MKALWVILPILKHFAMLAALACSLYIALTFERFKKKDKLELPRSFFSRFRYVYQSLPAKSQTVYKLAVFFAMIWFILIAISYVPTSSQSINKNVPQPQVYEHLKAGHNFYKQGDYNNALAEYNKAIEANPHNNETYYYRGATFLKTGENDKALSDFKKSIELDPHDFKSYRNLDWVLAKERKWNDIINYWNKFIQLEPEYAQAYLERGGAYYHQGNLDAALKDAKKSCDLGNSEGCMRYEQLKEKMGN